MPVRSSLRRYTVSLHPAVVARFQSLSRSLGMPPYAMSAACEDALKGISDVLQIAKDKGTLELKDIRWLLGQQLELVEEAEFVAKEVKKCGSRKRQKRSADTGQPLPA